MNRKFIKFPSIEQFRHVVKDLVHDLTAQGYDPNDFPKIPFKGLVKVHGTNASVVLDKDGVMYAQSRNQIITPENDNAGFAKWVDERKDVFREVLAKMLSDHSADRIVVYGEFAGENIQKNVAVAKLPKRFYPFAVFAEWADEEKVKDVTVATNMLQWQNMSADIYPMVAFSLPAQDNVPYDHFDEQSNPFDVYVDLNHPELAIERIQQMVDMVEKECPVALAFGESGIGEGLVFYCYDFFYEKMYRFKAKGEKHSASKVKLLPTVDTVMIKNVAEFVEQTVTESRLEQGLQYLAEMGIPADKAHTGDFIRWVVNDVNKEEYDIIQSKGLEIKLVNQEISKVAKRFYFSKV